jgi:hypothetical protein
MLEVSAVGESGLHEVVFHCLMQPGVDISPWVMQCTPKKLISVGRQGARMVYRLEFSPRAETLHQGPSVLTMNILIEFLVYLVSYAWFKVLSLHSCCPHSLLSHLS